MIDPEVREQFVADATVQAKQDVDRERPQPRPIEPIPVEGRDGQEPEYPARSTEPYLAMHLLDDQEVSQLAPTDPQSLDAQARALTAQGAQLIPELVQVCTLMALAGSTPSREQVDRLTTGLETMARYATQLRNSLATHR